MKVTKELKEKIIREVKLKCNVERDFLRENLKQIETKLDAEWAVEIQSMCDENPRLKKLLKSQLYRYNGSLHELVEYAPRPTSKEYSDLEIEFNKIASKETILIEQVIIKIQYGKTVDDIFNVFNEYGLNY